MAYAISITRRAESDLGQLFSDIDAENSRPAHRWYAHLWKSIQSLRNQPNRCPHLPEDRQYRQMIFGRKPYTYRVIYRVLEAHQLVEIVHVRHGARQGLNEETLAGPSGMPY